MIIALIFFWPTFLSSRKREFGVRINPAKSFYGSHAMAKTFLEMFAGLLQAFPDPVCGLYGVLFWEVRGKVSVKVWRRSAVKA